MVTWSRRIRCRCIGVVAALEGRALDVDVGHDLVEPARDPPCGLPEQVHQRGHEQHPHDECVDQHAEREAEADANG